MTQVCILRTRLRAGHVDKDKRNKQTLIRPIPDVGVYHRGSNTYKVLRWLLDSGATHFSVLPCQKDNKKYETYFGYKV